MGGSYINNVSNRQFLLYASSFLWKTIPYNSTNQTENYGEVSFWDNFYSSVNDVSKRRLLTYKNGVLHKESLYHSSNKVESFGNLNIYEILD